MYKKKNLFFLLLTFLFAGNVFAGYKVGERATVSFDIDDQLKPNPKIFIPVYWTSNIYSGVGYTSFRSQEDGDVDGFADSRMVTTYDQSMISFNVFTYNKKYDNLFFSGGLILGSLTMDRLELGYIHFPESLGDHWVAFENDVTIKVLQPELEGIIGKKGRNFSIRGIFTLAPMSRLKVEQTIRFKPIISVNGNGKSSTQQNLSYKFGIETVFKTDFFVDIGFIASRNLFPMKYKIETLAYDSTSKLFNFESSEIKVEEITYDISLRLLFKGIDIGGMNPAIGYGYESAVARDILQNRTETEDSNYIILGVEKRF